MPRVRAIVPDRYRQTDPDDADRVGWEGVLTVETVPTGDGRMFASGSMRWERLPLPLRWDREDDGGHLGAITVGQITDIWRDRSRIRARGHLDLRIPEARDLARLMDGAEPTISGVSVDVDDADVEIRVAAEILDAMDAEMAEFIEAMEGEAEPAEREVDEDGRVLVAEWSTDDELMVTTDGRIRAATIVDVPAFIDARLRLTGPLPDDADVVELVASAAPSRPPRDWFPPPTWSPTELADLATDSRTGVSAVPIHVTDDGRIYGHIAPWRGCHTGFDECVSPPTSPSGYRYFTTGAVIADDGSEMPVGRVTLDTGHAGRRLSPVDTAAHYEHTGLAVADVVAGEDAHGIWISGRVRPGVTPEQIDVLRASPPSGDWRRVGGALELIAVLSVNSPGFPVPRAMVASGQVVALQTGGLPAIPSEGLSENDRAVLRRMAAREREAERRRQADADLARRRMLVASAATRIGR